MRLRKIIIYTGYTAAFFVSLYLFIILSLPDEQIAAYINEKYIKPSGVNLSYRSARISYNLNIVFRETEIEITDMNQKLQLDRLEAGISVAGYIFGKRPFVIKAEGFGGTLRAEAGSKKDKVFIYVDASDIDTLKLDILKEKTGLNIKGTFSLNADIIYDKKESKNNNGRISIEFKGSEIKGGRIMGFEIPPVNTGDLKGDIEIKEGKFKITNFKSKGKDIELRLSGDGNFQSPPARSNLNLSLKVKPAQAFIDREEKLKTVLFGIGNSLDKEGFYNFSVRGTLSSPSFSIEKK